MVFIFTCVFIFIFCAATFKIVPQGKEYVIERLGKYHKTLNPGVNIILPGIDLVRNQVDMREQLGDYPPQPVITKDNVTVRINAAVYYTVFDPKLYTYGAANPVKALETLTATSLRNICGEQTLEQTMVARDEINKKMAIALDEPTNKWGISIRRVEIQSISLPQDIQDAMEHQMRAERERRALVTESEGEKQSKILKAEGDKESLVLNAQAEKEAAIAKAEGDAKAIQLMYEAQAKGIQEINDAAPSDAYVQLEGFKYLKDLANGQATKIIVPSNLQSLASTVTTVGELLKDDSLNVDVAVAKPAPDPYAELNKNIGHHDPAKHKYTD